MKYVNFNIVISVFCAALMGTSSLNALSLRDAHVGTQVDSAFKNIGKSKPFNHLATPSPNAIAENYRAMRHAQKEGEDATPHQNALNAAWKVATNTQRLEQLMDIVLSDKQRVVMAGLPSDASGKKRVRALALQLVKRANSGITMPNFPATLTGSAIMMQIQAASSRLSGANSILKLQKRYSYSLEQVLRFKRIERAIGDENQGFNLEGDRLKHFLDTVDRELGGGAELDPQVIADARVMARQNGMTPQQIDAFIAEMRGPSGNAPALAIEVAIAVLTKTLPMDHDKWVMSGTNFTAFVRGVIKPIVDRVEQGNAEQHVISQSIAELLKAKDEKRFEALKRKELQLGNDRNGWVESQLQKYGQEYVIRTLPNPGWQDEVTVRDHDNLRQIVARLMNTIGAIQPADEKVSVLNLASDPYTVLVRIPDQELEQILARYTPANGKPLQDVITQMGTWLKVEVEKGLDAQQRQTLAETGMFDETPGSLPGLLGTREVNRQALGRYIRLYNAILKDKKSEHPDDGMRARREASGVILMIAMENYGRCVDGFLDAIPPYEGVYLYKHLDIKLADKLGIALARLFRDNFVNELRKTAEMFYPLTAKLGTNLRKIQDEAVTYAMQNMRRIFYITFGLYDSLEKNCYGAWTLDGKVYNFGDFVFEPTQFLRAYFQGGRVLRSNDVLGDGSGAGGRVLSAFTQSDMVRLVRSSLEEGNSYIDDETLDWMINSDLELRTAWVEFQDSYTNNTYFANGSQPKRKTLTDAAIIRVMKRYGYVN